MRAAHAKEKAKAFYATQVWGTLVWWPQCSQFGHHLIQTTGKTNLCDHWKAGSLVLRGQIASKQAESARGKLICLSPPGLALWMYSMDSGGLQQALANFPVPLCSTISLWDNLGCCQGTEGQEPGSHQLGSLSLFDGGFPLLPELSLTINSPELVRELPSSPHSQSQVVHTGLIMSFQLLDGGLEQRWNRRKHRPRHPGNG